MGDESIAHLRHSGLKTFLGHRQKVFTLAWNVDGNRLATGSSDHSIRLWSLELLDRGDPRHPKPVAEFLGHSLQVDQVAWDPLHQECLASCSLDKTVRVWDARGDGKSVARVEMSGESINLAWRPNGAHIAVGGRDDVISVIDTKMWKVNEFRWVPGDVELFVIATGLGTIEVCNYADMQQRQSFFAHPSSCYGLAVDPLGRYLATGAADSLISLWDLNGFSCVRVMDTQEGAVRSVSFSHDGMFVCGVSEEPVIDICEVETGALVRRVKSPAMNNCVAWHPSRHILVFAGDDRDRYHSERDEGSFHVLGIGESSWSPSSPPISGSMSSGLSNRPSTTSTSAQSRR